MIYLVGLFTLGLVTFLTIRYRNRPDVKLAREVRDCALAIKDSVKEIKRLQTEIVHYGSEAYANEIRTKGWHEDEGDYSWQKFPASENEVSGHQQDEIRWAETRLGRVRTELQGLQGRWAQLQKQVREQIGPESEASLRKRLAENRKRAAKLEDELKLVNKEHTLIEERLAGADGKSGYREGSPRFKTRVVEPDEIDALLEKEFSPKKRESA